MNNGPNKVDREYNAGGLERSMEIPANRPHVATAKTHQRLVGLRPRSGVRQLRVLAFVALAGYSVALLAIERQSPGVAREFVAEITASGAWHGLNTSLCVFLLLGSALLFAVGLRFTSADSERRFLVSQTLVFAFLGCDDYFTLHERLGALIPVNDVVFLIAIGLLEIYLLVHLRNQRGRGVPIRPSLWIGGALFGAMALVDGYGFALGDLFLVLLHLPALGIQERIPYTVEDLLKVWGCAFLFVFAWDCCGEQIARWQRPAKAFQVAAN